MVRASPSMMTLRKCYDEGAGRGSNPRWDTEKKHERPTMYIQNRRDSSKFNGCSPFQNRNGSISLKLAIAYFAYTQRCT